MTQRKYEMRQRAAAVEETKRRILAATSACHREIGMAATGMDDVARKAGVAVGTVYRHFATLETLIGACGAVFMDRYALPGPEEAPALFRGLRSREARLGRMVDEIAARYRDGALGFVRVREGRDAFEPVAAAQARIDASLDALAAEATRPFRYSTDRAQALRALLDPRVWQSLLDQGLDVDGVERALRGLVVAV